MYPNLLPGNLFELILHPNYCFRIYPRSKVRDFSGEGKVLKVPKHSFLARVTARTRIAKTNMPLIERSFYLLIARSVFAIFFVIERSALMALVFHNKGMLEKVTMQRTRQILGFFQIERIQLNAAHAQLLKKLRPIAFAQTC